MCCGWCVPFAYFHSFSHGILSGFLGFPDSTHFITRRIRVFLVFPSRSSFSHSFPFEWKESSEWWENEGSTRRTRKKQWSEIRIPLPLVWVPFNKKKQDMRWTVDYSTNLWLMFPLAWFRSAAVWKDINSVLCSYLMACSSFHLSFSFN